MKFEIHYCKNNSNSDLAGKRYKPKSKDMIVMNNQGVFFVYNGETYYPSIMRLVDKIGNFDVIWK